MNGIEFPPHEQLTKRGAERVSQDQKYLGGIMVDGNIMTFPLLMNRTIETPSLAYKFPWLTDRKHPAIIAEGKDCIRKLPRILFHSV